MNDLVFIENSKAVTTSLKIAEIFGKEHKNVVRKIDEKKNLFNELNFELVSYRDLKGEERPMYHLDRDFTTYLIMGFTGTKADEWKLKYIDAFNKMEESLKKPMSAMQQIQILAQGTVELEQKIEAVNSDFQNFKMELPLLGEDMDEIKRTKNRKVVPLLGGKNSPAYCDNSVRVKVYRDLERQMNREFGVTNYKSIHRSQVGHAKEIIEAYELPMCLKNEIDMVNSQMRLEA